MTKEITVNYQGEKVLIEAIVIEKDLQFKVNLDHPIYIEKDTDEDGVNQWIEVNTGATLRAEQLGALIEQHAEL